MLGESHELKEEFPEHEELISELRDSDSEFAHLFDEYQEVNSEIIRTEQGIENHEDLYTEGLKKKRIVLKDQLYSMILRSRG